MAEEECGGRIAEWSTAGRSMVERRRPGGGGSRSVARPDGAGRGRGRGQ